MEDKLINIESWVERLSEMYAHTPKEGSSNGTREINGTFDINNKEIGRV